MTIRIQSLFLLASLVAAAPAMAANLPIPPIPPENVTLVNAAPLPDFTADAPEVSFSAKPSVNVHFCSGGTYDPSMMVASEARYQWSAGRKSIEAPGLMAAIPLQ